MRALIVQHHEDGPAGLLGEHLQRRGYEIDPRVVLREGSPESEAVFPDPTEYDLVVSLGSFFGVYQHDLIGSWIHREVELVRAAHGADVPVLGICFGAQVITTALGGRVEPSPTYEVGWYEYDSDVPDAVAPGPWFTWHGDRCALPDGVDELARNLLCPQAFRVGRSVGVQFHPEATRELVASWAASCGDDYFVERGTTAEAVVGGFDAHGANAAINATRLFDWFLDEVAPS